MKKSTISTLVVLTLALVFMIALGIGIVGATENSTYYVSSSGNDDAAGTSEAPFATIGKAITEANSGDTIKLLSDITLSAAATIPSGESLTIDLDGHTLSNPNGGVLVLTGNTDPNQADEPGDPHDCLTLTGNGTISGKENAVMLTTGGDYKAADLTLAGVTITTSAGDAVFQRSLYSVITLADGTTNTITAGGASSAGIYATNNYNYIVTMEIKGNGTLYTSGAYGFYMDGCSKPTITAPNVYAKGDKAGYRSYYSYYGDYVQAGYYSNNMSDYCAAGYVSYSNTDAATKTDYPYHISAASDVVLTKGTEISGYSTVQDAVNAAGITPSEIELYNDVTGDVTIASGQTITLEGMSKKLTGSITNNGTLTIMSGKYSVDPNSAWLGYALKTEQEAGTYTVVGDLPYSNGAYHISEVKHLAALQYIVNYGVNDFDGEKIVLDNGIDMSKLPEAYRNWTPIGTESNYFSGTFDGCKNTISNLTINSSDYMALFSFATGTIENLTMKDCSVTSGGVAAILVAQAEGDEFTVRKCSFENCDVVATSYSGICSGYCLADESLFANITIDSDSSVSGYGIGSLAGYIYAESFTARNCVNNAPLAVQRFGGGMISQTDASTKDILFENCTNNGTLTCTTPSEAIIYLAGFIGYRAPNATSTVFTNCKNSGNIVGDNSSSGNRRFGGFIGYTAGNPCVFTNCVNSGAVSGRNAGGFVGLFNQNVATRFISCTSSGDVTSTTKAGYFISESAQSNMWASRPVLTGTLSGSTGTITIKGETSDDPGYVARLGNPINGTYFTTLAAAVEAATDEVSDIYLLADTEESITITKTLSIETGTATKESGCYTMLNVSKGILNETVTGTLHTFEPNYVASITKNDVTKKYATLQEAIEAAESGDTIKLLCDQEAASIEIGDKSIILDLNGNTLIGTNDNSITFGLSDGKIVTIEGSKEGSKVKGTICYTSGNAGNVVINSGLYSVNPEAYIDKTTHKVTESGDADYPFMVVEGKTDTGTTTIIIDNKSDTEPVTENIIPAGTDLNTDEQQQVVEAVTKAVAGSEITGIVAAMTDENNSIKAAKDSLIEAATQKAATDNNTNFAAAVADDANTTLIIVDVAVNVKADAIQVEKKTVEQTTNAEITSLTFEVKPTATVTTYSNGEQTAQVKDVPVTNDYFNGNPITVTLGCAGIDPQLIIHKSSSDGTQESFTKGNVASYENKTFKYDAGTAATGDETVTLQITGFSEITIYGYQLKAAALNGKDYPTLQDAINAANPGDAIALGTDFDPSETITVDKPLVITNAGNYDIDNITVPDGYEVKKNGTVITVSPIENQVDPTLRFNTNGGERIHSVSGKAGDVIDLDKYIPVRKGYTFEGWYADSALTQPIDSVKLKKGITTVYAKWSRSGFADVKDSLYYSDAVQWAQINGVVYGVGDNRFAGGEAISRAQFITMIWRAKGCPAVAADTCAFTDVAAGSYYRQAVIWGVTQGIVKGTSLTAFSPNQVITRGQAVAMLARMAGISDQANGFSHGFADVPINSYYYNAVAWATATAIAEGITPNTFAPDDTCLRGQAISFLYRYFVK